MITELTNCRICKSKDLVTVVDLGTIYPSGFAKPSDKVDEGSRAPLVLCRCKHCGLVQLRHTVDLDLMYRQYWYSSSLNKSMVVSLQDVVNDIQSKVALSDDDVVIDIGANDCTMLGLYSNKTLDTVGFEPALNIRPICNNVRTWIPDYFSKDVYTTYTTHPNHPEWLNKKARVITAIAMFYDLPDPVTFVKDVVSILADDGIFVVQYTDLCSMLSVNAFDNICHEHLEYYSFEVVKNLLETNGLEIIDVSHNNVNGASIRVTAAFPGKYPAQPVVSKELADERLYLTQDAFTKFSNNIEVTKRKVSGFLRWAKATSNRIAILGASTKGNTLLQVCGVTDKDCEFASEVNSDKFDLITIGSNIPIIPEEDALIRHPDYFIVLPWHFKDSFLSKSSIKAYLDSGGKLVFPLPEFTVVTCNREFNI